MLEAKPMTPGRLTHEKIWVKRFKLALWKVGGLKIKGTQARYFFGGDGQGNQGKTELFWESLRTQSFQREKFSGQEPTESFRTQESENLYQRGYKIFWPCIDRPKLGECDQMRFVSKNKMCQKEVYLPKFSKLSLTTQMTSSHSL